MSSSRLWKLSLLLCALAPPLFSHAQHAEAPVQWHAKWITAPGLAADTARMPVFSRSFKIRAVPAKATLYVSALGQGQVSVNGHPLPGPWLWPGWTDYRKTVRYERYDVARFLKPGENIIGVMVGNGMYNVVRTPHRYTKFEGSYGVPKMIAQLELGAETIVSDEQWQVAPGPIMFSSIYGGEDYDARNYLPGWDHVDPAWREMDWAVPIIVDGPGGELKPEVAPPVVHTTSYQAVNTTHPKPDVTVYDLGQNFAGKPLLHVTGERGATVKLIPGELLNPDGTVSQHSSGGPMWFSYTLRGRAPEVWDPRFTYYGFRYVQVEVTGNAKVDSVSGLAMSSASKRAGMFTSSNELLNQIHALLLHALHNNEVSIFTDCPHREKLGWDEETHLVASSILFNDDMSGLYRATSDNIADAQHDDGDVPTIAPQYTKFGPKNAIYDDSPEWGSAAILAPWAAYRFDGDVAPLRAAYPVMQRYLGYLASRADNDGIVAYGLGDWYDVGPKPPGFSQLTTLGVTGTLMLFEDARTLAQIARLTGHEADSPQYEALAAKTAAAFNAKFWHEDKGYYDTGSQTAQAMPLALGIVPDAARAKVLTHLIEDIHTHDDHITAGEVGYPYLLRALMATHHDDVILATLLRKDAPSYGAQIAAGATALTEAWDANRNSSQDHLMLGAAEEFFYRGLAGIDFDMSRAVADERITIRPAVYGMSPLTSVKASFRSALGMIKVEWSEQHAIAMVKVSVPAGQRATIFLPAAVETNGHGKVIRKGQDAEFGMKKFVVGAGSHTFQASVLQM